MAADRGKNAGNASDAGSAPSGSATGQAVVECMHCKTPITDPTTRVTNGSYTYCCVNCSHAMEQSGPGSDPNAGTGKNHLRCSHCNATIVHEETMQGSGDQVFCCANCAAHAKQTGHAQPAGQHAGTTHSTSHG